MFKFEEIDESDAYGMTLIDALYRGASGYVNANLREYKAGSKAILWAVGGGTLGQIMSATKPVGILASDQAVAFVMTATANTPAAASPATLTVSKAWIAPNYNPRLLFDSRLREVPIRLSMFPSDSSGAVTLFTTT